MRDFPLELQDMEVLYMGFWHYAYYRGHNLWYVQLTDQKELRCINTKDIEDYRLPKMGK